MSVLFVLVPAALAIVGAAVTAYVWAVRCGQFDDLTTPAIRAALDDEWTERTSEPARDGRPSRARTPDSDPDRRIG